MLYVFSVTFWYFRVVLEWEGINTMRNFFQGSRKKVKASNILAMFYYSYGFMCFRLGYVLMIALQHLLFHLASTRYFSSTIYRCYLLLTERIVFFTSISTELIYRS